MSSKRMKYSAKFKLQVVKFTQESNNCAAGCEFCVNEKLFHDWRKQVVKRKCMLKNKCSSRRKLVPVDWVRRQASSFEEEQRQGVYIITCNIIIIKAKATAVELQITGFLASNYWCMMFLRRKNLAFWQKTKITQRLPEDLDQKIANFSFVIKSRRKENYELVHNENMDKMPFWFDMPSARTTNVKGTKTVLVNTTGLLSHLCAWQMEWSWSKWWSSNERPCQKRAFHLESSCTVIWGAGWTNLKPWLEKVCQSRAGGLLRKKGLLVWDSFQVAYQTRDSQTWPKRFLRHQLTRNKRVFVL